MNYSTETNSKPTPPPTAPYDPLDPDQNPIPLPPDTNPEPAPVREPDPPQPITDPEPSEPTRLVKFCTTGCQPVAAP